MKATFHTPRTYWTFLYLFKRIATYINRPIKHMHCLEEKAEEIEYLAFFLNIHRPRTYFRLLNILLRILPFRSCKIHGLFLDFVS